MQTKIVVYSGQQKRFVFTQGLQYIFEKNIPRRVPQNLCQFLPSDFKIYQDDQKNDARGLPILIDIKKNDIIYHLIGAKLLKQALFFYPYNHIEIKCHKGFEKLFIGNNVSIMSKPYDINNYINRFQILPIKKTTDPIFSKANLQRFTYESAYCAKYDMRYDMEIKTPAILSHIIRSPISTSLAVIHEPETMNDRKDELVNILRDKCNATIIENDNIQDATQKILEAKYIISIGNVRLAYLALSIGKQVFAYTNYSKDILNFQNYLFNNIQDGIYKYAPYNHSKSDKLISESIYNLVMKDIEINEKTIGKREKITIPLEE